MAVRSISVLFPGTYKTSPSVFLAACSHDMGYEGIGTGFANRRLHLQKDKSHSLWGWHYGFISVIAGKTEDTCNHSRRQQDFGVFTEYVHNLCAAFRVLVQNSSWQGEAAVVFACGLVGKCFLTEKNSFL